jgi:hypothetical protein
MANHLPSGASQGDVPAETRGIIHMEFDDANMMIVISLKGTSVKAQQQIYYNYGKHGNDRLLSNYGFTVWPNRYHCIQLLRDAPAEDEDLKQVAVCDGSIGLTREAWRYYRLLSLSVPSQEQSLRERWAENDKRGIGSVSTEFVDLISEIKALVSPSFILYFPLSLFHPLSRLPATDSAAHFSFLQMNSLSSAPPFSVTFSEKYQPGPRQGGPAEDAGAAYPHSARTRLANVCVCCAVNMVQRVPCFCSGILVLPHQLADRADASPTSGKASCTHACHRTPRTHQHTNTRVCRRYWYICHAQTPLARGCKRCFHTKAEHVERRWTYEQGHRECSRAGPKGPKSGRRHMSARERALVQMACELVDKETDLITRSQLRVKEMYRKVVAACNHDNECQAFLKELRDRVNEARKNLEEL